jgi:nucleoside-triphosphatase THEP1
MELMNPDFLNAIAQVMLAGAALIAALRRRVPPRE